MPTRRCCGFGIRGHHTRIRGHHTQLNVPTRPAASCISQRGAARGSGNVPWTHRPVTFNLRTTTLSAPRWHGRVAYRVPEPRVAYGVPESPEDRVRSRMLKNQKGDVAMQRRRVKGSYGHSLDA